MRTITYKLADLGKAVIHLGKANENEATRVQIDAGVLFAEYPTAVPTLKVINPAGTVYNAEVTRDGDYVLWDIKDSDLTENGSGEFQLTFTENGVVVKSAISRTQICPSITGGGTAPDPVQDWLDHAEEVLEEVEDAFPEGGTTGQVLAKKSDADFDTEWVDQGAGGTTDYTDLENKPQIGGVTLTGNVSLHDIGAAAEADIPDPTSIIDDTAGSGDTDKTWSADKLTSDVLSAITPLTPSASDSDVGKVLKAKTVADGKVSEYEFGSLPSVPVTDVQVNGSSVLNNGVANVPKAGSGNVGCVKVGQSHGFGIRIIDSGANEGVIYVDKASTTEAKAGTDNYSPISPSIQHYSAFYGLAKAAGNSDQSSSANAVGTYTADAIVKIQKMLGIYESPWELIREDTVTNATEADIVIDVDGDGNAFELTDLWMDFESPQQETEFVKGDYGRIRAYYSSSESISLYIGNYTQAANASKRFSHVCVEQKNGRIKRSFVFNTGSGAINDQIRTVGGSMDGLCILTTQTFVKVSITSVKGTGHYKLYGRRKWN